LPEYAERQFEVTVKPSAGVRAADEAVFVREIVRACAEDGGANAIFAPVLTPDGVGNGTHIHVSLTDRDDRSMMHDPDGFLGISGRAAPFVAGILDHLPALCALTAPSVASYFRLRPNKWAPTTANLGERDRGAALRVCPVFGETPAAVARGFNVEYRVADATASPYIALGAIVHAGLDGMRRGLTLPHEAVPLPRRLADALDVLERSAAAVGWLGREFFDCYLMFKRSEIEALEALSDDAICERYARVY
jgi:glutamine synthetase